MSSVAQAIGIDASDLVAPVDPPAPAGDLKAEIDHFTTLDACVAEHANMEPLVGDALRAIGYDTFLRDACRLLAAMKTNDKKQCAPIDAQGLRAKCQAYVAMRAGTPDACPLEIDDAPIRGRDARCVAVASRDARLCAGEARDARATCEAMIARDEARCAGDATCRREAARWKNVLGAAENAGKPLVTRATLTLRGAEGTANPTPTETDLSAELARGVVVLVDFDGAHVELGTPRELGATSLAPPPATRARVALRLVKSETNVEVEHAEIAVPGGATLVVPGARFDGAATVTKLDETRGGEVALTLGGTLGVAPRAYDVKLEVSTFVRDVVRTPTAGVRRALPRR